MATLLERIAQTRQERHAAEQAFRDALKAGRPQHSWSELAAVAGLTPAGVRYLVADLNARRKTKGDKTQ